MIVAIQPSTGEILAVAQNAAADVQGPIALTGKYPPGSTFKIVTATAGIDGLGLTPTTQLACPASWTTGGREIHNAHDFDLGTVDMTLAFAKSCNTTFAQVASSLPADALHNAALQYGVGLDFDVKGIITLTGQSPVAESVVQQAENGFGQGTDLLSPFAARADGCHRRARLDADAGADPRHHHHGRPAGARPGPPRRPPGCRC